MEKRLKFNKKFSKTVDGEKIEYRILWGNEKIVFIKSGVPDDIEEDGDEEKHEYVDKYLIMAHRVHELIGATVICASNCDLCGKTQLKIDKYLIKKVITDRGLKNYELYFVGTSDGGEHSLKLSQQFPEAVKFLGLNSSWSVMGDFLKLIKSLPQVKKIFVYGADDVDFDEIVPRLKRLDCENLDLIIIDGADHDFKGKVDDFIALIDLL